MKTLIIACLMGTVAVSAARAGAPFTFDTLQDGDEANLASRAGIRFEPAYYAPDLDLDGWEIPGTDRWRIDYSAPPVTVTDPELYGGGPAPSPSLALDAFLQPVLVLLPGPGDLADFSFILDGNTYGDLLDVLFLDGQGQVLLGLPLDQTVPYLNFSSGPVSGVASVLLPAGAFYDNVVVPESGTSAALALLGGIAGHSLLRRRSRCSRPL